MIVYSKYIPFKGFKAINLFGIVVVRKDVANRFTNVDATHEAIHTKQMIELAFIGFYIWYIIEYIIRLIITRDFHKAYRTICFEEEAYGNEYDSYYPDYRKHYSFIKYI